MRRRAEGTPESDGGGSESTRIAGNESVSDG